MIYSTARWVALRTILQTLFLIAILLTVSKTVGARPAPYQCSQPHGSLPPTYISMREAANYALAAGFEGENAAIIVAIAWAESDPPGNIFSCGKNADGSWDRGILQINDFWIKHGVDDACAFDPACAFKAAYKIVYQKYGKTRGFNEWVEYINGGYMKYLDAARQAIQEEITTPPGDSDQDGIPDSQDRCPYEAGPSSNGGCPPAPVTDSDNDGVPDGQDACPYEPGPSWNNGCPEVPRPTNQPPIARFIFSPANPSIDQPVRFDASSSFDPDPGDYITEYRWDFNDDRIFDADGPIAYHTFSFSASYQVTLMVVDSRGAASFQHQVISVSGSTPPPPDTGPPPPPPLPPVADSDNDGIPDSQDRCPYQAGPGWNDGCPVPPSSPPPPPPLEDDSDQDGIPDSQDRCPYQAGPSWNGGCPEDTEPSPPPLPPVADSDNDGIPDSQDRCPYQAGPGWNDGCPVPPSSPPPPSSGSKTIEAALDTNGNGILDDDEILRALQYWSSGEEVPGTDGHTIDDAKMLELLDIWASRRLISSASAQSRSIQIGRAESLTVREIKLSPNPVKSTHLATFRAEGSGIAGLKVEVFNLEGMKVSEEEASGNTLRFYAVDNKGRPLANGVYLYVVRVRGFDGREYVSEVRKLVIMR